MSRFANKTVVFYTVDGGQTEDQTTVPNNELPEFLRVMGQIAAKNPELRINRQRPLGRI